MIITDIQEVQPEAPQSVVDSSIIAQAEIDAAGAAPGAPPGQPAPAAAGAVDYQGAAVDLVEFAGALFFPIYPSLAAIYDQPTRARIAEPLGQVFQKYRVDLGALGCELTLAIVLLPTIAPAAAAIQKDRTAKKGSGNGQTPQNTIIEPNNPEQRGAEIIAENPLSHFPGI